MFWLHLFVSLSNVPSLELLHSAVTYCQSVRSIFLKASINFLYEKDPSFIMI